MGKTEEDNIPTMLCKPHGKDQWKFKCPYCKRNHYHGSARGGHRVAHCMDPKSPFYVTGYYIKLDPNEINKQKKVKQSQNSNNNTRKKTLSKL